MATATSEVTDAEDAAAAAADVGPQDTGPTWAVRHRWTLTFVALGAVLVAVVAFGAVQFFRVRSADAQDAARSQAVQAADQIVVSLTSMTAATGPADVARLLAYATGSFHDQFSQQATTFEKVLKESRVTSVGKVVEAGVVSSNRTHAVVLTAVTATVKNAADPKGEQRVYRMLVSLERQGGHWLVSDLEFVP